jgi:hypothetical protein
MDPVASLSGSAGARMDKQLMKVPVISSRDARARVLITVGTLACPTGCFRAGFRGSTRYMLQALSGREVTRGHLLDKALISARKWEFLFGRIGSWFKETISSVRIKRRISTGIWSAGPCL